MQELIKNLEDNHNVQYSIEIDKQIKIESQISTIWKKVVGQLNALSCLTSFSNQDQMQLLEMLSLTCILVRSNQPSQISEVL